MENRYCPDVAKPERFENLEKLTSLEDLAIPHPSPPLAVSGGRESIFFPPYKGGKKDNKHLYNKEAVVVSLSVKMVIS